MNEEKKDMQGEEFEDSRITLTDENGNEVDFDFLDSIEYNGVNYVVLLPVEDDDSVVIMELEELENGDENLLSVDDTDILDAVYEMFKERNNDIFDFED